MSHSALRSSALPLLVAGAFFMENLDGTVIVTAMPQMASAFAVHPIDMNIGISAYILTLTVFIPASGWIANRFGARNIFAAAMVIFTLASVLCALSTNLMEDTLGFLLTGSACFGLMFGLELFNHQSFSRLVPLFCIAGSLILGACAVYHAKRQTFPLIDLWALQIKSYSVTVWGGGLFRMAIGAVPFLLPLLFQIGFGLSAFSAGLLVLAVFAGNLAMKPFTSAILYRFRFRPTLLVNGLLNAATIFACALITPDTPNTLIIMLLFVSGLTRSMQFTALNTLAFSEVPPPKMAGANTLSNMAQQLAIGLGIAIGALALRIAEWFHPYRAGMIPLENFQIAFVVIGVVALLSVVDTLALSRDAGDEVRKKPIRRGKTT